MRFNSSFNSAHLKHRFSTMNPIIVMLSLISIAMLALILLPFLLLLGLLSFITFQVLGRTFLSPKMKQAYASSQRNQGDMYQGNADIQRENPASYANMFTHPKNTHARGRTFEHNADEPLS
ncbi:hypothetical protein [Shewanella holmiensis]|uniref:Uncharacterized protein n=1 Tax=Shewanella holmiensis TaxID=2952222 RepID=A0A9X2WN54_9GAMM|nr:hypothetical protein [Shewanella holmiensis]MCT7942254.1 hypothetical protein [Shewanella holmiensis]